MTYLFLISFYILICVGFVIGALTDNNEFPNIVKVLIIIFSPIYAPLILGVGLGIIIITKIKKGTNRE